MKKYNLTIEKEETTKVITLTERIDVNLMIDGNLVAWFTPNGKFCVDRTYLEENDFELDARN